MCKTFIWSHHLEEICAHTISLTPPRLIDLPVTNQESQWSCVCMLGVMCLCVSGHVFVCYGLCVCMFGMSSLPLSTNWFCSKTMLTDFCFSSCKINVKVPHKSKLYYGSQARFGRHIVFAPFLITSPQLLSGDVLLFYVSFSLLLLLLLLFFHTFLSARFLWDALIKLYETL